MNSSGRRNTSGRCCDGSEQAPRSGSSPTSTDAFTRPSAGGTPRASAEVLERDRSRSGRARRPPWQRVCPLLSGHAGFANVGGMPPLNLRPQSRRYLSFVEREEIAVLRARGRGVREIARQLGRSPSTISRELRRNAATGGGNLEYRATTAQWHADRRAKRPKLAKLATNGELRQYVQDRLGGLIRALDGAALAGPDVRLDRTASRSPTRPAVGGLVESRADRQQATGRLPRR